MFVHFLKVLARVGFHAAAVFVAYSLYIFHTVIPRSLLDAALVAWPYALGFSAIGLFYDLVFRVDRTPWRFASIHDVLLIIRSSTVTTLTFFLALAVFDHNGLAHTAIFLAWMLDMAFLAVAMVLRRSIQDRAFLPAFVPFLANAAAAKGAPLLMLGDIASADTFLREIAHETEATYKPVGLITADTTAVGREIRHVRILATFSKAAMTIERFSMQEGERAVLFLDQSIVPADLDADLLGRLRSRGVRLLRRVQAVELGAAGAAAKPQLREINLEELLSRPPVHLDLAQIRQLISNRKVLVTGAGGSIGSEICRQVASLGCAHIGLLDNSEFALFKINMEIGDAHPTLSRTDILCDVRDAQRVNDWVAKEQPDLIFHAAALKHVPLMECHPCESILTNVVGTWNVAEAAAANGVGRMVFISTDKAVDPSSVMGATKRLAESVVRLHREAAGSTQFSVVRFGNVLGSAGSVVPTFLAQINRGGPVTVTHPDIERYFMTIPEAVQLVLHAMASSMFDDRRQSGVFVLDMGKPVKIMDLARRLIELSDKSPARDIEIQITGLRPGEKLTEELVDSTESAAVYSPGVMEISDRQPAARLDRALVKQLEITGRSGSSEAARRLIFEMLQLVRNDRTVVRLRQSS